MKYRLLPILVWATLNTATVSAQTPGTQGFREGIQKIVAEYPHEFGGIRGRLIEKSPQTAEYAVSVTPEGISENSITSYSTGGKAVYSWQGVLLRTEDFGEAAKKYKWAFSQLRGMNVTYVVDKYTLRGTLQAPDESRNFTSSDLELAAPPDPLRKLRIRVQLQYEMPEWKVSLVVYDKERDDQDMASSD